MSLTICEHLTEKDRPLVEIANRFIDSGHRCIVLLVREDQRKPDSGCPEHLFLNQFGEHGIPTSAYNLADVNDHPEEPKRMPGSLFRHTPPTA